MHKKVVVAAILAAAVAAFFAFDLHTYLSVDFFKAQRSTIDAYVNAAPVRGGLIFLLGYVAITGLSLPGAAVLTLLAGAIFGLLWGTLIVSFASSIGATLAFLMSRFLLRDWVQARFGDKLESFNEGMKKDGAFYLFTLRLLPPVPFFLINLIMGLTPIKISTFYWVSQFGMLAGTLLYVYAGTQLGRFEITWQLLAALTAVGVFPFAAKRALELVRRRKLYARWVKPTRFDRNVVVIGAGSAGLVSAYIAAAVKAKVTLIEKERMGGDCLYTGCVPSKALIRSTRFLAEIRRCAELGVRSATVTFDFADVMERVQRVIKAIAPHDSTERYTRLGVECLQGAAKVTTPWSVEVDLGGGSRRTLTTRSIVIAAGARPSVPAIPGLH